MVIHESRNCLPRGISDKDKHVAETTLY